MVPGFSSTTGIQISMARFSKVSYNSSKETVDVGAGCLWDEVYNELTPRKRNVVGGAARQGVGVGGWLLGGGYSLKSNKYGLGIDNIVAFRVVGV
jgi:FAD/FMN-containing dehydrogenase